MSLESDSVWATPNRGERVSPPEASPKKLQRVCSDSGHTAERLDGGAPGGTPLTTTASSQRTVNVMNSPTFSPGESPDKSGPRAAAHLLRLRQAQLAFAETAFELERARDKADRHAKGSSSRDGGGSDRCTVL